MKTGNETAGSSGIGTSCQGWALMDGYSKKNATDFFNALLSVPGAAAGLCNRVLGVLAHTRWLKCENDVRFRDAGSNKLWGDAVLRVIGLDPQLAVDEVNMHERMMNAFVVVPTMSNQSETAP